MRPAGTISRGAAICLLVATTVARGDAGAQQVVHLVDDRGRTIGSPLEVCFELDLRADCRRVTSGETVRTPPSFNGLRIEGENHGPASLRREELRRLTDGSFRVVVQRKAALRVIRPAWKASAAGKSAMEEKQPLTVSLYSPSDGSFREPIFRVGMGPDQSVLRVPAGELIVSFSAPPYAPDLHRIAVRPGAVVPVEVRERQGWSLIVRCLTGATARPLGHVEVKLKATAGYGAPEPQIAEGISGADGLLLVSGIAANMASVSASHVGLLPAKAAGVLAATGTFTYRELSLVEGGRVRAIVSLHGRPVTAAHCRISELDSEVSTREKLVWEGEVDPHGVCRSGPLAEGKLKLSIQLAGSMAQVHRWVVVAPGRQTEEDVALSPTRVSGVVRRRAMPAPAYMVIAAPMSPDAPRGAMTGFADQEASRDDGRYELMLWTAGAYLLYLKSPSGAPVGTHRELMTDGDDDKNVDFDLGSTSVSGVVVDEQGQPVPEARVGVEFQDGGWFMATDAQGGFGVDLQGSGAARLTSRKQGYRASDPIEVQVQEDQAANVTIVLKRDLTARGTLLTASSAPVAGALVASVATTSQEGPQLYAFTRSDVGGTFEVRVPGGVPHLFVSGPGCPLFDAVLPPTAPSDAGADDGPPPPTLRCPALPASVQITLLDDGGKPVQAAALILRQQGTIVPQSVLALHLTLQGLAPDTDGAGHLVIAGLSPGTYDLFLNTFSSEATIAAGLTGGYLTSVSLPAMASTELQLTLPVAPLRP